MRRYCIQSILYLLRGLRLFGIGSGYNGRSRQEKNPLSTPFSTIREVLSSPVLDDQNSDIQFVDVGCADGALIFYLALSRHWTVHGIDVQPFYIHCIGYLKQLFFVSKLTATVMDAALDLPKKADMYYLAWTTWAESTRARVAKQIETAIHHQSIVISVTFPIHCSKLDLIDQRNAK